MTCPALPGVIQLIVEYGFSPPTPWILVAGGWLGLLGLVAFLLRREARSLPPGLGRRMVLWLMGTGLVVLATIYPLIFSGIIWDNAGYNWSTSMSDTCYKPARQALQDQRPALALVVVSMMLLLFGVSWALIGFAQRRKRQMARPLFLTPPSGELNF